MKPTSAILSEESPLRQNLLSNNPEVVDDKKRTRPSDRGICWLYPPTSAFHWDYFLSIRGGENLHLYMWILKDLSWTQEWYYPAWTFGTMALVWAFYLLFHAAHDRATNEIFIRVAVVIWIFGNWWWITGEVHDWNYPDEPKQYDIRTIETAYILDAGLCWLGLFYLIVKPLKLFDADNIVMLKRYDQTGLPARLPFIFSTWREYENLHILFWMSKGNDTLYLLHPSNSHATT